MLPDEIARAKIVAITARAAPYPNVFLTGKRSVSGDEGSMIAEPKESHHHIRPPLPGSFRARLLPLSGRQPADYLQQGPGRPAQRN